MGHIRIWNLSAAFVLFAGAAAAADSTPPQLVGFSISPASFDSSSGPAILTVTIRARDDAGGAGLISGGAGIVLTHESGSAVFGRPILSVTSGASTDLLFQFSITIPQSSPVGVYGITLTVVDASANSATFDAPALQALGFASTVTITEAISSAVTLGQAAVSVSASGGSGLLQVTAQPGAIWSAVSNASWLTIVSGNNGTGNGAVTYSAAPNNSSAARIAIITVNSQVFAVTQAAGGSALSAVESALLFVAQAASSSPATKPLTIFSTGAALTFTAAASSPGNWLSVSAAVGVTPAVLNVSVNTAGLPAGTHSGAITLSASGSVNSPQTVSVILIVNSSPDITVAPEQLTFSYQQGSVVPPPQSLSIASSGTVAFSIAASSAGWLLASPATGATPSSVSVSIAPSALAPGSYGGAVTITGPDSTSHTVPVRLTVSAPQQIAAPLLNPLTFAYTIGGVLPGVQVLTIPGASGTTFSASAASSGNWLKLGASTGTVPAGLGVAVSPAGLAVGVYTGTISLNVQNMSQQSVPVTLVVTASISPPANFTQAPSISPTSLTFSYQPGAANPGAQSLSVTGSAGAPFNLTTSSASWLSVSPLTGTAPATLTVSVNPSGLAVGTYAGTILMTSSAGAGGTSQNIGVTLTVTGPVIPPVTSPPHLTSVVNDASLLSAALAPGEIISIFGTGLGPEDPQAYDLAASVIGSSLGGTRVIINGKAAPIILAHAGQVATIVPYSVAGRTTVQLQLEYQGVQSTPATFAVADAAPGVFTLDRSGRGQAALLNEDTSINFDLNPADRGTIAVLYASGAGLLTPSNQDGAITGLDLAHPVEIVSVLIDGQNAPVLYAGSAPYEVSGVLQVNFRIPPQVRTGSAVGLLLKVGRFTSQPGVTLAIR